MPVFQTVWPCFPLTLPVGVAAPRPCYMARSDYGGVVIPCFYNAVIEKPSRKESRRFLLDRSVFDLVDAHLYLALTDPKLLGWYLSLSPEDRKIIQDEGGFHHFLQRHPALELSRHHVYVKYNIGGSSPVQPTMTSEKCRTPPVKTCKCEVPQTHLELEMLHSNVKENLSLIGCSNSRGGSQEQLCEEICHSKQLIHLQDSFHTACNSPITQEPSHHKAHKERGSPQFQLSEETLSWQIDSSISSVAVCKDPAALVSFSLDRELEQLELRSQVPMTEGLSGNLTYAEVSPLQSEWSTIEKESPSKYYSFDSMEMDGREYNDRSIIQSVQLEQVDCPLGPSEENSTKEECQDDMDCGNECTVDSTAASLSSKDQRNNFHSIMEDDKSILVCLASEELKAHNNGFPSGPVTTNNEALADTSETIKSDHSLIKKSSSPVSCVPTCNVMVGTELALSVSAFTQSEDPETADKHVITEVHMADLDYLAEEFIKLRTAQEVLREQKEKRKSLRCKLGKECDCLQRAQRAELCLLALQYSMCRQQCWRLYYTSEGEQLTAVHGDMNQCWPKDPLANISSVVQKLESDYNQMRNKILAGVPMEQLEPLSVNSEKIISRESYIPAQIIGDVLGNLPSGSSLEPQECNTAGEENRCPGDQSNNDCQSSSGLIFQISQGQKKQVNNNNNKTRRAVTLVPQDRDANHAAHKLEGKQTITTCKELKVNEAWYDAEENLEPAGPAVAAETGQDPTITAKDRTSATASEEAKSSVLCVSNLPSNVTESDVMLWFEKYHASEVSVSVLKNEFRVAIVMVNGPQSAEAAVRELNGFSMEGHTLYVEHINRAVGGSRTQSQSQSQSQASASISESSQDATKPQPPRTDPSSTERKLISQPPLSSSIKNRKMVCISPTAKGTCVPQHYGTMGSFDTLMAELMQLHPDVGKQRIVDALVELRAKHQGVLSGLPLRTIREMTSKLLTRPENVTQL
ncbi:RNA-binding protein 44 isoform X3 [Lates japonicus]|uniref:RNA-binding protein 44 isoform X3 n=1 Tax=Lates japonicus TaxID=270547 RepID=A0AAD3MNB3_LATJO|nr:RNA-binding protein 44 isoform X3 [Lates japonicus]